MIVIDYDPLTPMNEGNINSHLLFGVNGAMVQTTICNGKVLMKDREVLVCDEAKVMADCRQVCKRTCRGYQQLNADNHYFCIGNYREK